MSRKDGRHHGRDKRPRAGHRHPASGTRCGSRHGGQWSNAGELHAHGNRAIRFRQRAHRASSQTCRRRRRSIGWPKSCMEACRGSMSWINNAAAVFAEREVTPDGLEKTFAVNLLAPFALTHLLLDLLRAAPAGRILTASSEFHSGELDFSNLQGQRQYNSWGAYKRSKLCNVSLADSSGSAERRTQNRLHTTTASQSGSGTWVKRYMKAAPTPERKQS